MLLAKIKAEVDKKKDNTRELHEILIIQIISLINKPINNFFDFFS